MDNMLLQELKTIELDMLKTFISICQKYNLRYFVLGGTALGAVRHKGFIPWDDDIDVGMPRLDYEKFTKIAQSELKDNIFLQTIDTEEKYPFGFAKLRNSNTTFLQSNIAHLDINHGIYIDVFPLDGVTGNRLKRAIFKSKEYLYSRHIGKIFKSNSNEKQSLKGYLLDVFLTILFRNSFNAVRKRSSLYQKYDYDTCDIVANYYGAWGEKEIMPKSFFGEGTKGIFENVEVCLPQNYDSYLKCLYGDYMTPPPEEKRESHHFCDVIDTTNSYFEYCNNK